MSKISEMAMCMRLWKYRFGYSKELSNRPHQELRLSDA